MISTSSDSNHRQPPNFIVFGEMGVGKSSLINLIAGEDVTKASSSAQSCTLDSTEHTIRLTNYLDVHLYDTAGLNEPTIDNTNYLGALVKAHKLIQSLQEKGGIHGILFCIRVGRISNTTQQNYKLIHDFLCQKTVPVSLVVTGLENEPDMDGWWTTNETTIKQSGIASAKHVCITTTMGYENVYEKRYKESRKKVHKLMSELASETACPVDGANWFRRVCKSLRGFLTGKNDTKKVMQVLTNDCKLPKDDAKKLIAMLKKKG
ncbi:hypothetical protein M405DRAFT_730958 [Rhizopogon salebrosus TDB-379]|nr:hypothetical protein M405DRAFT_730958 [Rhizopogon salebrosus TDB-379]